MNRKIRPSKTKSCSPPKTKKHKLKLKQLDDYQLAYFVHIQREIVVSLKFDSNALMCPRTGLS